MHKTGYKYILSWEEAWQEGPAAAGNKGWNLARLHRYGFKVPAGCVLGANAYRSYMRANQLDEEENRLARALSAKGLSEDIIFLSAARLVAKIRNGNLPPAINTSINEWLGQTGLLNESLAVRSSSVSEDTEQASAAGIYESYLNVSEEKMVCQAVKDCYASIWNPRAIIYRRRMNIPHEDMFMAVVLMEMVESVSAGVGFTCDPVCGREDVIFIAAGQGLGVNVVDGGTGVDEYRLDASLKVIAKTKRKHRTHWQLSGMGKDLRSSPGNPAPPLLDHEQLKILGLNIRRVFDALGGGERHQDIEWAYDGRQFFILQARPVTVLPRYTLPALEKQPDIWSNANFADSLPMVISTMHWSLIQPMPQNLTVLELCGYKCPSGLRHIKRFSGRLYWNFSVQQWLYFDALGTMPHHINQTFGGHQPEIILEDPRPYRGCQGFRRRWRSYQMSRLIRATCRKAGDTFQAVEDISSSLTACNLNSLADNELMAKLREIHILSDDFMRVFLICNGASGLRPLKDTLERYKPGTGRRLANALLIGQGNITSAGHGLDLQKLAEIAHRDPAAMDFFTTSKWQSEKWQQALPNSSPFKNAFIAYIDRYGHRGLYECDMRNPRWYEDQSYLLQYVKTVLEEPFSPSIAHRRNKQARAAWEEVKRAVPITKLRQIKRLRQQAIWGAELREQAKSELARISAMTRMVMLELGKRLAERGILEAQDHIFDCTWTEAIMALLGLWDGRGLKLLVRERQQWSREMEAITPPDFFVDGVPSASPTVQPVPGQCLYGTGIAAGKASGAARLLTHPGQVEKLRPGDVLVAASTDPGWTPLFLRASAIVVESGGTVSHGAIVAREYGIPAVANIPGILGLLKDGQDVLVDGDNGIITVRA